MLSMLNTNLDFALTDYVTVNFKALADAIDVLGGLDIEMTNAECVHANNYNREVSEAQGVEYEAIPYDEDLGDDYSEVRHVSGALATSYARIRYGGGDDDKTYQPSANCYQSYGTEAETESDQDSGNSGQGDGKCQHQSYQE